MLAFYIISGIAIVILMAILLSRTIWNIRLSSFQKRNNIEPSKMNRSALGSNIVSMSLLLIVGVLTIFGASSIDNKLTPASFKFSPVVNDGVTYENARAFSSQSEAESVFSAIGKNFQGNFGFDYMFNWVVRGDGSKGMLETTTGDPGSASPTDEGISDTYNQVKGVTESDFAKIHQSGKYFIYAPRGNNKIHRVELDENGNYEGLPLTKQMDNFYPSEIMLYEDLLLVFGYYQEKTVATYGEYDKRIAPAAYYYQTYAGYAILDANTLEVIKMDRWNGYIVQARLVNQMLYLVVNEYIQFDDQGKLLPMNFENIFYFKGESNSSQLTKIYSIDLSSPEFVTKQIGFVGGNQAFYMGNGMMVLINYKWRVSSSFSSYYNTSSVIAVSYDELGNMKYVGSQEIEGYVSNQYFMDVYEGMIRIVTTFGKDNRNSLYVLKPRELSDKLEVLSVLSEGLGKPNEHVKSVTFNKEIAKVVTFLQTDPLYTIDLSDPKNPKITSAIEEPGFSSVLLIWDDQNNTVGIGYMADETGRVIGIKVSAYRNGDDTPTQTIEFPYSEYGYLNASALHSPREHLLINEKLGILGFIASGFREMVPVDGTANYQYENSSRVLLFDINFEEVEPIKISELSKVKVFENPQKLLLVKQTIHILSPTMDLTWNLTENTLNKPLFFEKNQLMG